MQSISLLGLLVTGCIASEAVVTTTTTRDSPAPETVDTDLPETTDSGDEPPERVPDYTLWQGTLRFQADTWLGSCDDTVTEKGRLLPKDHVAYTICSACDVVFALAPSPEQGCVLNSTVNLPLENPTLRGLNLGDGWAAVYNIETDSGPPEARLLDSGASLKAGVLQFAYNDAMLGELVDVTGSVTFPLVEAR